eukprot:7388042-Prymnesium_polylepis.1
MDGHANPALISSILVQAAHLATQLAPRKLAPVLAQVEHAEPVVQLARDRREGVVWAVVALDARVEGVVVARQVQLNELVEALSHRHERVQVFVGNLLAVLVVIAQAAAQVEASELLEFAEAADHLRIDAAFVCRKVERAQRRQLAEARDHVVLRYLDLDAQFGEPCAAEKACAWQHRLFHLLLP